MTAYHCRFVAPRLSAWFVIEADAPDLAANELHNRDPGTFAISYTPDNLRPGRKIHFARVEVEGYGSWLSRIYTSGIIRKGGTRIQSPVSLADVAQAVGWNQAPDQLVTDKWHGEDSEWS